MRRILLPLLAAALLASGCGSDAKSSDGGTTASTTATTTPAATGMAALPGAQNTPPPWGPGSDQLQERLDALGLPALPEEAFVVHIHQHLDMLVNGQRVLVPAGIGIDPNARFIAELHTHDPSGILHVESPKRQTFTLGQVFGVWGVPLSATQLGSLRTGGGKQLKAWVNGRPLKGDPAKLNLASHQEIVIAYGTADQMPGQVPARYRFPAGY